MHLIALLAYISKQNSNLGTQIILLMILNGEGCHYTAVKILSLIRRIDGCKNNFENSSTINECEYIFCGYSMSTIWTFDGIENKHDVYRREDCIKTYCESLREHARKIINFEKKKIVSLIN